MQHCPAFLAISEQARKTIQEVSPSDVKSMLENKDHMVLIDVREDSEWAAGHLPSAIHLSKGIIERDIEKTTPDRKKTIVLYCGGGYRSALAAVNLQQMGYENVYSMWGGFRHWMEAGFPTA